MKEHHYADFKPASLILRDHLAIDRTLLANERTLLAYLRSGVAMVMAGFTILHFLDHGWFWVVGAVCPPIGILAGTVGIWRYIRMHRAISLVRSQSAMDDLRAK